MASAFAQAGMKVMIADIETDALDAAVENLRRITPDIDGSICDVADAASVERAAQATFDAGGIGVSVLCPSYVRTKIGESGRNRPQRNGASQPLDPASPAAAMVAEIAKNLQGGLDPADVAARVIEAIRDDQLYIFTHPGMRAEVEDRFAAILAAMDAVTAS
jgi:NAD(P)-dependent dehydrogenase (short-subunit alcohol dehydrogenase family)